MSTWMSSPQEIRIPISYGYIAAKSWGQEHHEPVLALHGWQDNAGTFDKLIPLLSQDLFVVAVDLPGHGLSSHIPTGTMYSYMQYLVELKRIMEYMKWDTVSFMGHSFGGQLALLFSATFPDRVKNVILLDIVKPTTFAIEELADYTRRNIESLFYIEKRISVEIPVYSLEEARRRLRIGLYNQVTPEEADILLKRGCIPSKCGKGVVFSRDARLQVDTGLNPASHDSAKGYLRNMHCNLLIIIGNDKSSAFKPRNPELLDDFLDSYRETCGYFKYVQVDGDHYVHLNNPQRVAPHIDDFFEEQRNNIY